MSRTIEFRYDYPYCGYSTVAKYGNQWSDNRVTLNGSYTYPIEFNNTVPKCRHIKIDISIENTGYGTIYERSWSLLVDRQYHGWANIHAFTLPTGGNYAIDCDVPGYYITRFAVVPSSTPGSGSSWTSAFTVKQLRISETITTEDLVADEFQYGVFPNRYGVNQNVNEIFVNMGGTLTKAKDILVNHENELIALPKVYSGYFSSTFEKMKVFEFMPDVTATYTINQKRISGDHEIRLYDSSFNQISDGYFYNEAFALNGGSLYYISVTHYYNAAASESRLLIFKN